KIEGGATIYTIGARHGQRRRSREPHRKSSLVRRALPRRSTAAPRGVATRSLALARIARRRFASATGTVRPRDNDRLARHRWPLPVRRERFAFRVPRAPPDRPRYPRPH